MKKFGKFLTFVTVAGAAAAGFMYFLDKSQNSKADDDEDFFEDGEEYEGAEKKERSYVTLNSEAKEALDEAKEAFGETKEALADGKESLKKAVKAAAQDIIAKAEDAAKGVGLVKEDKEMSDFQFEDFDKVKEEVSDSINKAAEDAADSIE